MEELQDLWPGDLVEVKSKNIFHIFSSQTTKNRKLRLFVSITVALRMFTHDSNAQSKEIKHWVSAVFSVKDIIRKEEHDWKMAYLAREEGADNATISWKFDLSGTFSFSIIKLSLPWLCQKTNQNCRPPLLESFIPLPAVLQKAVSKNHEKINKVFYLSSVYMYIYIYI